MNALDRKAKAELWKHRKALVSKTYADVAEEYGLDISEMTNKLKIAPLPEARREVMTRLWESGLSLSEIGRLIGCDHSTVYAACRKSLGDQYVEMSPGKGKRR